MVNNTFLTKDPFNAPIPGQSLTGEPGANSWEQPPQFTQQDDALIYALDRMTKPNTAKMLGAALDKGVYASDITNGILIEGVAQGKWNVDLAALMARRVFSGVVAVGAKQGVTNIKYRRPDRKYKDNMSKIAKLPGGNKQITEPTTLDVKEEPVQINGAMGTDAEELASGITERTKAMGYSSRPLPKDTDLDAMAQLIVGGLQSYETPQGNEAIKMIRSLQMKKDKEGLYSLLSAMSSGQTPADGASNFSYAPGYVQDYQEPFEKSKMNKNYFKK